MTERKERMPSELAPGVWGVLEVPGGKGQYAGVVLLHGSYGWHPALVDFASSLSDLGFVVLAIDYYAEEGRTASGSSEKLDDWPAYQAAVRNAVAYLQSLPSVAGQPIGLVGFSRGAFLAVSVASSTSGVRAVVDFYGGGGRGLVSLEEEVQDLPPVLILHGVADSIVPVRLAYELRDAVVSSGGEAEMYAYPGAGHNFNVPHSEAYSADAANDAHRRTIEFLRRQLSSSQDPPVRSK